LNFTDISGDLIQLEEVKILSNEQQKRMLFMHYLLKANQLFRFGSLAMDPDSGHFIMKMTR
jgi:hypothetical protein